MPKNNATENQYFVPEAEASLKAYFGRVREGQPNIYETPFAEGESTEELLSGWKETLVSIKDKWPSLWEFEEDLETKVGPLSVMKPLAERMGDVDAYYDDILLSSTEIRKPALERVTREFSALGGMRMRNQILTVNKMKTSTNSGSPFFSKRRDVILDTVPCQVWKEGQAVRQALPSNVMKNAAAVIGWRGQEGGPSEEDVKQRVVWMFPFAVNVVELSVYQPLIEGVQRYNLVPAWVSMEAVDERITRMFDTKSSSDLIVCTDFSRFDQHFNGDLQDAARSILSKILSPVGGTDRWLYDVFPIKYMIPLCLDLNITKTGKHGMASGSGGTNADETLAHRALQYEAAINRKVILNPNSQCLGDDGILTYPGITVEDVVESYSSHGQLMNVDKQYSSTQDCVYLRRWHHTDFRIDGICVGVYSTLRALGRMRYQERFMKWDAIEDKGVSGPEMVELRYLSILENVKWHPLRDDFARYCMKRDKFRLGLDLPGFLPNIKFKARKAIDYMPEFLGYTKSLQARGLNPAEGIENWWIVKFLRSV
nr:RNA-dependent RNA polymerase [Marmot picobirnavirus]